jgi:hypothetical protein
MNGICSTREINCNKRQRFTRSWKFEGKKITVETDAKLVLLQ